MKNSMVVGIDDGIADLNSDTYREAERNGPFRDQSRAGSSLSLLHHHHEAPLILEKLIQPDDVLMLQLRDGSCFRQQLSSGSRRI